MKKITLKTQDGRLFAYANMPSLLANPKFVIWEDIIFELKLGHKEDLFYTMIPSVIKVTII